MKQDPLIRIDVMIKQDQRRQLIAISTKEIVFAEHIRRAIDIYLSQPLIQDELKRLSNNSSNQTTVSATRLDAIDGNSSIL